MGWFRSLPNSVLAWSSMILIGLLWGLTIPLTKIAVSTGHQPFGLIFWQTAIGVILLGSFQLMRGWRPKFTVPVMVFFTVISFSGTLIPNFTSYLAQQHLPAGVMAIVIAMVPMFSLSFAILAKIETPSIIRFSGIVLGFVAMVLIAIPETSLPDPSKAIFVLIALIAPVFYGFESVFVALRQPDDVDAITILFMASLIGCIIVSPLAVLSGQWINPLDPWGDAEWALIASSAIHAMVYCTFIWLVRFAGPVFSDQASYPVTLSGVVLSIVLLGEGYSSWIWLSLFLVMFGLALVQPRFSLPETSVEVSEGSNG